MKRVLLIIGGGIAAYKCLELIRRLREQGVAVRTIMTKAAEQFVTPLSVGALSNERVFTDLFSLDDEREIGHIRLARDSDLIIVAPATADLLARMANGLANDLATAVLLATNKPILVAPAMNPFMWQHPATQRNMVQLRADGVHVIGPNAGEMAERGEAGVGRLVEVAELVQAAEILMANSTHRASPITQGPLSDRHVLLTSGPTHEPIDPVRYIANRSSGKQGHAIAAAAAALGARVTLVSGPVALPDPPGVTVVRVQTALEMLAAVETALPADIAIMAAAVADWRPAKAGKGKLKKSSKAEPPSLKLVENPDILRAIAKLDRRSRPALVIGFAAETSNVVDYALAKLKSKGCDWIVANDVSTATGTFGGDNNTVHLITRAGLESWPSMSKQAVAETLILRAARQLADSQSSA